MNNYLIETNALLITLCLSAAVERMPGQIVSPPARPAMLRRETPYIPGPGGSHTNLPTTISSRTKNYFN